MRLMADADVAAYRQQRADRQAERERILTLEKAERREARAALGAAMRVERL
jgi:hypothetical protein